MFLYMKIFKKVVVLINFKFGFFENNAKSIVISTKYQHNDYFSKKENHKSSYVKMFFIVSIDGDKSVSGQALFKFVVISWVVL